MSVRKSEDKKCLVIHVMKDAGYVNKLCCSAVLYYCGSSHWRCSGLDFVTFNLVPRAYEFMVVKLLFSVSPPMYSGIILKTMPSIWENFDHVHEVFQGLFFKCGLRNFNFS